MKYKILLVLLPIITLTSCSFNKVFLHPTQSPEKAIKLNSVIATDNLVVNFSDQTYQPTFIKNNTDTLQFDYAIESVVFTSSNGNKLNGWLVKPKNTIITTTLLHFHGNSGFILSQYRAITPLLKYGFQIFLFDYSGFGFSEGKAKKQNILIDALSALNYIKSRQDMQDKKLVIYGQSLGGHVSAVVAAQKQDEIDGLVIEGAFSSHKDIAADKAGIIDEF